MNPSVDAAHIYTLPARTGPAVFDATALVSDTRYEVRIAEDGREIETALRLRHRVFNVELANGGTAADASDMEFDEYDLICRHLIVIEKARGMTVGTYRLNSIETAVNRPGFYSHSEFSIEDLPDDVVQNGVEIGRACIAPEHRNTKVLFLLWKGLANYLRLTGKRYFFGCCSIFTRDHTVGEKAFHQLAEAGNFHPVFRVEPRRNALYLDPADPCESEPVELPSLFNMYLRVGARVCGPPTIDEDFGTIDFFVVFDREDMTDKCRKMFFE